MVLYEEDAKMHEEYKTLPQAIKDAFSQPFNFGWQENFKLHLNSRGGMQLIHHLRKFGLEIRPIEEKSDG